MHCDSSPSMIAPREDRISVLLGQFPGPHTLRRSVSKWLRLLAIGIVFVALGLVFIYVPFSNTWPGNLGALLISWGLARDMPEAVTEVGWAAIAFFGIGSIVCIITLLPGAAGLTIDKDGFIMLSLFRRHSYQWLDVGEFEVIEVKYGFGSQKVVGFNDHLATESTLGAANMKLFGRNSALPDTYGLSVEDLARLMSLWHERAVSRSK